MTPVERYALKYMESSEECWSAEQLRAAEAQIEEQKRAWELKRLATLTGNDDERGILNDSIGGVSLEPDGLLTYAHQDSVNQVKKKPGRPRSKSNLNRSVGTLSEPSRVGGSSRGKRRNHLKGSEEVLETPSKCAVVDCLADTTITETDDSQLCVTPEQTKRKRTRVSLRSESTTPDVSDDASSVSNNTKALSPRTRSRGTVNINLWTLDVKSLLPGVKGIPSPKTMSNKVKDECSPVPSNDVFSNGCESENTIPSKKAKRGLSTELDIDPDLDVVS